MEWGQQSPESPLRERQLGFYERFRVTLHDLGYHNNVSIIAHYSYETDLWGSLPQVILHALGRAIQEHPALAITTTRDEKGTLFFQRLGSVNLEKIVRFETLSGDRKEQERRLIALSAEENNRAFENTSEQPLWRAVILQNDTDGGNRSFWVAFFWHHVIGDGRSGLAVHQTVLEALSSLEKDLDCKTNRPSDRIDVTRIPASTKPLFVSMEQALPNSSAASFEKVPPTGYQGKKWAGENYNDRDPVVTQLAHVRLPAKAVQQVLEACRRNNTTMTALLQAVMGKVLFENMSLDRIRTAVAVSLRRFFSPSVDDSVMGLWISTYTTEYQRSQFDTKTSSPSVLWQRAQDNSARINDVIADGGKNVEIMSLMGVDDYETSLKARVGQPRDNSFGLTNLGVFRASRGRGKTGLVIDDMIFSQSCHANGAAFQICIVSVQGCDMNIVFNWQKGVVSQEKMQAIGDAVRTCLIGIASDPADGVST